MVVLVYSETDSYFWSACRWYTMVHADGSVLQTWDYLRQHGLQGFINIWPKPTATAWKIIACYAAFEAALQLLLPGKRVEGPISPAGNRPVYKVVFRQYYWWKKIRALIFFFLFDSFLWVTQCFLGVLQVTRQCLTLISFFMQDWNQCNWWILIFFFFGFKFGLMDSVMWLLQANGVLAYAVTLITYLGLWW